MALMKGEWIAEAALWLECRHSGDVVSDSAVCEVACLKSEYVHTAAINHPSGFRFCRRYAALFANWVKQTSASGQDTIWDVWSTYRDVMNIANECFAEKGGCQRREGNKQSARAELQHVK
eukprot:gnl/TRDRNA2_/TRDRNA2_144438_c2_seq1.p2 gnl/TRDRNA2_/TRDRNA2_144438_c2~~gnl/TRDRNA2_/TRDRNA2_144438_c2_seq1.p2  ORF type:complete len:120 (-),score=15.02 gnl/TRDRNA2_/TRDRNA2_144438_c2_seq1:49-408(-)